MSLKVRLGHKPKRKPNLVRWMSKHNVSTYVMSSNQAVAKAIESQQISEEYERE